jgi:broad specificity phosphatase PhoE
MIPQDRHVPQRAFVVRHGQTVWNSEGRLHGQLDAPLTADGIAQARSAADLLVGSGVRTVCSSPLGRALRTAVVIAERIGAELIQVPDLAEMDLGELAGMTWSEIERDHPGTREERAANRYGWRFPGGESYAQVRGRARRALSECGWSSEGPPLLVTHEMVSRMLRAELRGLDAAHALSLRHPLGVIIEVDGDRESVL